MLQPTQKSIAHQILSELSYSMPKTEVDLDEIQALKPECAFCIFRDFHGENNAHMARNN